MVRAIRFWLFIFAALSAGIAHAVGVSQTASRINPQAVIISQAVSGISSTSSVMKVNYGPISSTTSSGYDLTGEASSIVAQSNTAPIMGLSTYGNGTETQDAIIASSWAYIQTQISTYVPELVAYAKTLNVGRIYYTLDQEVMPTGATSSKRLVWTLVIDDQGHATYGEPSIYDSSPSYVYISYTPLAVESDLPQSWQYTNAGVMTYELFSTTGTALSAVESVNTEGAYDAPQASSTGVDNDAGLECLIDNTSSSTCSQSYPTAKGLIGSLSAKFAIVDYLRMVQPVYNTVESPAGSGTYVQQPAVDLAVTLRTWYYASCTSKSFHNTGYYGYTLSTDIDRYYVQSDGSYSKVFSYTGESSSPYENYDYTRGISDAEYDVLSGDMIDPSDPSDALLAASTVPYLVEFAGLTEGASNAASPYTLNSTGSYGSGYANSAHDHILEFSGNVTTSYADSTTYTGTDTFTISDVSEITSATLLSMTGSDFIGSVDVNGTTVYSSVSGGGRVYKCQIYGQGDLSNAWYWPGVSPGQSSGPYDYACSDNSAASSTLNYCSFSPDTDPDCTAPLSGEFFWYNGQAPYNYYPKDMMNNYGAMTGNVGTINQDIRSHLVNGTNTVSFNGVIGGYGYSGSGSWDIKFEIVDACGG